MAGKTIKIYLKDGLPTSLLIAEIFGWAGKVYVVPRSQLVKLADRREIKQTGIYLLVGQDLNEATKERVYIGESENVWLRLKQHNDAVDKDFWNKTIIIIGKDENLTKAHVRYLESQLIKLAQKAHRAVVVNRTYPPAPPLPESDIDDMEYFLEQVRMLLPVLGFSFLQTLPSSEKLRNTSPNALVSEASPLFWLKMSNNASAEAREINGEFIVLKGSHAQKKATSALLQVRKILRDQLQQDGRLRLDAQENFWVFTEDVPFNSPSSAASVVTGTQTNGRTTWKVKGSTQTYKDWQEKEIEGASS
ncbi:MAG: GIY-YIG nuclease family protein [Ktedonobacteraceae bacterium]